MAEGYNLIALAAESLHERAAFIVDHADSIYVRIEIDGRWENRALFELPSVHMIIAEAFRLLLRAPVPHRVVREPDAHTS